MSANSYHHSNYRPSCQGDFTLLGQKTRGIRHIREAIEIAAPWHYGKVPTIRFTLSACGEMTYRESHRDFGVIGLAPREPWSVS
jgi:hypothetical protein